MSTKLIKAAKRVVNSEIPSLRHRIADGYAVVEAAALDALNKSAQGASELQSAAASKKEPTE